MPLLPKKLLLLIVLISLIPLISPRIARAAPWDAFFNESGVDQEAKVRKEELADPDQTTRLHGFRVSVKNTLNSVEGMNVLLGGWPSQDPIFADDQKGAIQMVGNVIASLYAYPPASGIAYTQDVLANAGVIAKPAYAQGIGFAGLTPFLPLWKASRDLAYAALILIMVGIGFMIIFRMKIDPKTVISIQAAIPKIVLTLIIITFSYPIAGFMIDIMYISMAIIISLMVNAMGGSVGIVGNVADQQTHFMTADIGDLFKTIFYGGFATINNFDWSTILGIGGTGTTVAAGAIAFNFLLGSLAFFPAALAAGALGFGIPAALFLLILLLGLLFTTIRMLLLLLNSYIQLIISLILGPIVLLQEAIPGRSAFSEWLMNILANLVVFPATVAVFLFATFLTTTGSDTTPTWMPPFIGFAPREFFSALLGLGTLFLAPNLVAQIKKLFHPKPVLPITAGTAVAPLTGGIQTGMGAASQFYYLQHTPFINRLFGAKGHQPPG